MPLERSSVIYNWIKEKNEKTVVNIMSQDLDKDAFWFYDMYNGRIINRKNSFFSIYGSEYYLDNKFILEQPIIIQNEVGYLGILCKMVHGLPYFYLQSKIEPGNVNVVQISPTIQATKSNFTRAHGGSLPKFFNIFESSKSNSIIYDNLQTEQSTRFYKKSNRNIIMRIDDDLDDEFDFKWISYVELLSLMKIDNLVNMDTRTVISGFPYDLIEDKTLFNTFWLNSIYSNDIVEETNAMLHMLNNSIMFINAKTVLKPLFELRDWDIKNDGIICNKESNFDVKYFNITIEGREVYSWSQPLFCSRGCGIFGLIVKKVGKEYKILVSLKRDIGSHNFEFSPSIQLDYIELNGQYDSVQSIFFEYYSDKTNVILDVLLSEEGGRFYHEQNRNIIIEIDDEFEMPEDYVFVSLGTLKSLIKTTQLINIQLRNLISLINVFDYYED